MVLPRIARINTNEKGKGPQMAQICTDKLKKAEGMGFLLPLISFILLCSFDLLA